MDIPWDHITHDDIEQYYRDLTNKDRLATERLLSERTEPTPLTPDQESRVRALLDETHRQAEDADRRAAKKAHKKAQKAAKKADAAKRATVDYNNADNRNASKGNKDGNAKMSANGKSASNGKDAADNGESPAIGKDADANAKHSANANNAAGRNGENGNSAADTNAPTHTDAPASDRGAIAVANALARHPEVDLDTALENHHSTAGIPKEDLTHEQIYDAITAEANFQKRQAIIQSRLHPENPDVPNDSGDPNARSP